MQQIQQLTEDFMNLIEVEGLGQPASDVPPSTNKIKRDIKTKNGKVELVSVEDELFPKDGDKREQLRQKVIDTINGMIQGTATLEDLLQIVRQKKVKPVKEGFEGAIELLEELITEKKEHVFLKQDLDDAKLRKLKKKNPGVLYVEDEYLDLDGSQGALKKRILANTNKSKSLKEAIELLEEVATYLRKGNKPMDKYEELLGKIVSNRQKEEETSARRESDGTYDGIENSRNRQFEKRYINKSNREQNPKDRAYYYATRDKKTPEEKVEASIARHEKKEQKKAPLKEAMELVEDITNYIRKTHGEPNTANKSGKLLDKAAWNQRYEEDGAAGKEAAKALKVSFDDEKWWGDEANRKKFQKEFEKQKEKIGQKRRIKDFKTVPNSADFIHGKELEEAMELTEAIINEIAERTKIDAYKKRVKQHLDRAEHDRKLANEFAEMGGYDHAIDYLKDADKSQKKEYKHRLRTMTHDKKFGQDAYNKAQKELFDEWKANKNKKIEEAFELLETALTAIRNSGLPKEKQEELTSKLAKGRAKERELADEKAFKSWAKGDRKHESSASPFPTDLEDYCVNMALDLIDGLKRT